MYKALLKYKTKYKKPILAALYLAFLLAETSEFFVALNTHSYETPHPQVEERHLEMPSHLPEDSKSDFLRLQKKSQKER